MNHEIREKFKSPDIISVIKLRRLEWLGHVMIMNETRVARKILDDKPGGKRRIGRPRLRWTDDVEEDLRSMGIKRWRTKSFKQRRMGIDQKGSQGQTQRAVVLQEEDEIFMILKTAIFILTAVRTSNPTCSCSCLL
jgi:hypothetical protein